MTFRFKLGKKPARPGSVSLRLAKYLNLSRLPAIPADFGDERLVTPPWGMLGNADYGCCAWAGAAHETMVWTRAGGKQATFTTDSVLSDYSACTGFKKDDPNSDQGTDMQAAASYRKKVGIADSRGVRHKLAAYVGIDGGDIQTLLVATYLFEAVGIGLVLPESAQDQFDDGKPWDVVSGSKVDGGHYVSAMGRHGGMFVLSTWGSLTPATDAFIHQFNDENIVGFSAESLNGTKTLEGFDTEQLLADLKLVSR